MIGGLFDGTARLACSIAGVVGKLGDLLKWLFIPDELPWSDMWEDMEGKFPFTAIGEAGGVFGALTSKINEDNYGEACGPVLDLSSAMDRIAMGADTSGFKVGLPNPSTSGCPGSGVAGARTEWDNTLGDIWGYRALVRGIATLFLVVLFVQKLAAAFGGGETGLEAGNEENA